MCTDMYEGHACCGPSTLWQGGQQTVRVLLEQCLAWKPEQRHVSALCVCVRVWMLVRILVKKAAGCVGMQQKHHWHKLFRVSLRESR